MKEALRKEYIILRKRVTNKEEKSQKIAELLAKRDFFKDSLVIAIYSSLPDEVDTKEIFELAKNMNKTIVYPKVKDNTHIDFFKVNDLQELKKGSFNIMEPQDDIKNLVDSKDVDLMIIPGICFDLEKNRLGYGKGYYDRYLENNYITKIGICFSDQVLKEDIIPTDEFDIKMDYIVTENEII